MSKPTDITTATADDLAAMGGRIDAEIDRRETISGGGSTATAAAPAAGDPPPKRDRFGRFKPKSAAEPAAAPTGKPAGKPRQAVTDAELLADPAGDAGTDTGGGGSAAEDGSDGDTPGVVAQAAIEAFEKRTGRKVSDTERAAIERKARALCGWMPAGAGDWLVIGLMGLLLLWQLAAERKRARATAEPAKPSQPATAAETSTGNSGDIWDR